MNLNHNTSKKTGDQLTAIEWNNLAADVNELGAGGASNSDSHIYFDGENKHNLNIVTTDADQYIDENEKVKGAKINIEPYSDLQIKAGDDITLYSHHREDPEELAVKVLNGAEISATDQTKIEEYPVDLQLNASNVILTTKDKAITISEKNKARQAAGKDNTADKANIMNIEVKTGVKAKKATASNGQYGYLKVRANAIDIRCEDHGGIALQPKGYDSDGNMNKIKFEHGGGDGLEFGTFNPEKSSLYTDEYRFKRDGVIKLATRQYDPDYEENPKTDDQGIFDNTPTGKDATNAHKWQKQEDDFYDIINDSTTCTWADIVYAVNRSILANRRIDISSFKSAFEEGGRTPEPLTLTKTDIQSVFLFELFNINYFTNNILLDDGEHVYNATVKMVHPLPSGSRTDYIIEAVGTEKKIRIELSCSDALVLSTTGTVVGTYNQASLTEDFPTSNPTT